MTEDELKDMAPLREGLGRHETPEWHKPVVGRYHASQLPMCVMKQYLTFKTAEEFGTPSSSPKSPEMWIGNLIHEGIERDITPHIRESFTPILSEHECYYGLDKCPGAMIVGKLDHLALMPNGELAIIDVKTMGSLYFIRQDGLSPQYVYQLSFYQKVFNVKNGYIWGVAYRDGRVDEELFPAPFEQKNFGVLVSNAELLHSCLMSGTPPPACPMYGWECMTKKFQCHFLGDLCPRFNSDGSLNRDVVGDEPC